MATNPVMATKPVPETKPVTKKSELDKPEQNEFQTKMMKSSKSKEHGYEQNSK